MLLAAYPKEPASKETVEVYIRCLADIPGQVLEAAVLAHVSGNKWFPTIAELRDAALQLLPGNKAPTPTDAWAEVRQGIWRHDWNDPPTDWSHPAIAKTVEAIGWDNLCTSETPGVERGHFLKLYDVYCKRLREDAAMLPEVRRTAKELQAGPTIGEALKALADAKRVK